MKKEKEKEKEGQVFHEGGWLCLLFVCLRFQWSKSDALFIHHHRRYDWV